LTLALTGLSGGIALSLSTLLGNFRGESYGLLSAALPCFFSLLILSYAAGFLDCVLSSAMAGEVKQVRWPGRDVGLALKSGTRWLLCFLAGPIVPAGASLLYWLHGGDLVFWDWIILAEVNILGLVCWFLLLLAVNQNDRLRDINPARVLELIDRFGHRLVGLAGLAAVLALTHGWWASVALEKVHSDPIRGWWSLLLSWTSAMFVATFLFRWAGVSVYWNRLRARHDRILAHGNSVGSESPGGTNSEPSTITP
jgi:hypothetical protein